MPEGCRDRLAGEYIYWQWQGAVPACPVPQILLSYAPSEEGPLPAQSDMPQPRSGYLLLSAPGSEAAGAAKDLG